MLLIRTAKALIPLICIFIASSKMKFTSLLFPQYASNSLPSPKRAPGIATLKRDFKANHCEQRCFSRKPLFLQDVEHMIDVCGIDTPQQLQSRFITHQWQGKGRSSLFFFLFLIIHRRNTNHLSVGCRLRWTCATPCWNCHWWVRLLDGRSISRQSQCTCKTSL